MWTLVFPGRRRSRRTTSRSPARLTVWTLVFPGRLYSGLNELLFSTAPRENGCFLLANHYKAGSTSALTVTEVLAPGDGSWNARGRDALEPSSAFINRCAVKADERGSSLLFVHTHPNLLHPPEFSRIDEESNRRLFANLAQILPGRPLGSLVFGRSGICGTVFDGSAREGVGRIKVVGRTLEHFPGAGFGRKVSAESEFDRQARALGGQAHETIRDMTAAVVGAGGTGSPVAVQLARMGVKRLILMDPDTVDETNLPRVYGAARADVGRPKVDVLKRHIASFSECGVDAVRADATDGNVRGRLTECDVVFACTDNLTSRAALNEIAYRHLIPLIDVGCRIRPGADGRAAQAVAKVQAVTPDSACLWCSGTLDGKIILQESFSGEEKERLAGEGYYDGIEKQPSVVSLTTMAASMAVNKLLGLLGAFGGAGGTRTQVELKDGFMLEDSPSIRADCVCRKNAGVPPRGV